MPNGYGYLKKGDPFMTALCRRKTHASRKALYVVAVGGRTLGLRAPISILAAVHKEERQSRARRHAELRRRDGIVEDEFRAAITRLFPRVPRADVADILKRALRKHSGRVGRTGKLSLDEKVRLAVTAHIRHCHTAYDTVIKGGDRASARQAVSGDISAIMRDWGWQNDGRLGSKRGHSGRLGRNIDDGGKPGPRRLEPANGKKVGTTKQAGRPTSQTRPPHLPRENTAGRRVLGTTGGENKRRGLSIDDAIEIDDSIEESDTNSWDGDEDEADDGDSDSDSDSEWVEPEEDAEHGVEGGVEEDADEDADDLW
ncbi:hypothetical protein RJ55_00091 [Drechmeria coniospora]|nr:hypothetical protein RJ55_00091 [Drechmeria coniospora]